MRGQGRDTRGKLKRLAARWASGRAEKRGKEAETEFERDCRKWGIDPAAFGPTEAPDDEIPVWPDMVDSFALFCDASWNWVGFGMGGLIRTHIIRNEIEASARLLGVVMTPAIFSDIRVMEGAALRYWSERRS